ncbi:MAG: DUF3306 domain-containing protein [Candidatus Thiodiazotropha sp.]
MKSEDSPQNTVEESSSFYNRWSERKQAARQTPVEQDRELTEEQPPGDEDMPPLQSLDENSDYSGFLSPRVSDELRQLALRKLFQSAAFNVCDGLDDYAEDFTSFEKLGDIMTADLRHRLEQEAKREQARKEEAKDQGIERDDEAAGDRPAQSASADRADEQTPPIEAEGQANRSDEAET